jgi:hypothetical protein
MTGPDDNQQGAQNKVFKTRCSKQVQMASNQTRQQLKGQNEDFSPKFDLDIKTQNSNLDFSKTENQKLNLTLTTPKPKLNSAGLDPDLSFHPTHLNPCLQLANTNPPPLESHNAVLFSLQQLQQEESNSEKVPGNVPKGGLKTPNISLWRPHIQHTTPSCSGANNNMTQYTGAK